jgi:hypothetical protein
LAVHALFHMSGDRDHGLTLIRGYRRTIVVGGQFFVEHARAYTLHIPIRFAMPTNEFEIQLGKGGERFPISEGLFIRVVNGWTETFVYGVANPLPRIVVLILGFDPEILIIPGIPSL